MLELGFFPPLWNLVELHGMLITTAAHNFKMKYHSNVKKQQQTKLVLKAK